MEIVTFFSFKGGVGRTQALLNTACEFAHRGKNVLLIDFDVHAPGLSIMDCMQPENADAEAALKRPGALEFFEWLVLFDEALSRGETPLDPINLAACAYAPNIKLNEGSGFLKLVPAASRGCIFGNANDYSDRVHSIDSPLAEVIRRTHRRGERNPIIEQIRSQFNALEESERPDVVFIDARTGITGIADLLLTRSSDRIVLVSGLNQQNIWGLKSTLEDIKRSVKTADWLQRITIVVSPVPLGEHELTNQRLGVISEALNLYVDQFEREMFGNIGLVPEPVEIPYDAQLALADDPILFKYANSLPAMRYQALADRLGGKIEPLQFRQLEKETDPTRLTDGVVFDHPYARVLPWHAGLNREQSATILHTRRPKLNPDKPSDGWMHHLLNYLAIFPKDDPPKGRSRSQIFSRIRRLAPPERVELLQSFRKQRQRLLSRPKRDWPRLAEFLGSVRVRWLRSLKSSLPDARFKWDDLIDEETSAHTWDFYLQGVVRALHQAVDFEASLKVLEKAEALAHLAGNRRRLAKVLTLKGDTFEQIANYEDAVNCYQHVLNLYREISDLIGEANSLRKLGDLFARVGNFDEAHLRLVAALSIFRNLNELVGQGNTLQSLGRFHLQTGNLKDALEIYQETLSICRRVGDRLGEANALQGVGDLKRRADQLDEARTCYNAALTVYREIENVLGEANTLRSLGSLEIRSGNLGDARECLDEALDTYQTIGDRFSEAVTMSLIGDLLVRMSDLHQARIHFDQAIDFFRQIGGRIGEADALRSLGDLQLMQAEFEHALESYERSLAIYRETKVTLGEANVLRSVGDLHMRGKDVESALVCFEHALAIFRRISERVGEANTLQCLGELHVRSGGLDLAKTFLDEALEIFVSIKEPLGETNTLRSLAAYHLARGEMGACQNKINKCLALYGKLSDDVGIWETTLVVAGVRAREQRFEEAKLIVSQVIEDARAKAYYLLVREAQELVESW